MNPNEHPITVLLRFEAHYTELVAAIDSFIVKQVPCTYTTPVGVNDQMIICRLFEYHKLLRRELFETIIGMLLAEQNRVTITRDVFLPKYVQAEDCHAFMDEYKGSVARIREWSRPHQPLISRHPRWVIATSSAMVRLRTY